MPINTGIGLVGIAIQEDQTTPAEKPQFVHGLTGGTPFQISREIGTTAVACGLRGNIDAHLSETNFEPNFSFLGYQEVAPVYSYGALGTLRTEPAGKPGLFKHTITIGETLPSLTVFGREGQTEAGGFGKTVNCKVSELEFSFSDTEPLTMNPTLMGCNLIKLLEDACAGFNPLCFDGFFTPVGGEFKLDTAGQRPMPTIITEGTWTITNDCEPVRDPTTTRPARIAEKMSKAAVSLSVTPDDFDLFWRMVTGSSIATEPAKTIVYGSYYVKFMHDRNPDFTLEIEGRKVPFSAEVPEVDPEGAAGAFTFSSDDSYVEKVGDSPITITIVNDIENYFDPSTYSLPNNVPEPVAYGEVLEGVEAEELGTFNVSGRAKVITGTANRIVGHEGIEDGYYMPLSLENWEGATVSTTARGAAIPFKDELAVVPLGTDGIEIASITVTDGDGEATTYQIAIECAEELPPVTVSIVPSGEQFGRDVSEFGTFAVTNRSRVISGTAEYLTNYKGFGKDPELHKGYYVCLQLDPAEGAQMRLKKQGAWGEWKPGDSEPFVVRLGGDSIECEAIGIKAADGTEEEFTVDVTGVDEVPPVQIEIDTGEPYQKDASELGSYSVDNKARTITGTATHLTSYPDYPDSAKREGYYLPIVLSPYEGSEVKAKRSEEWDEWDKCEGNGEKVIFLGKEEIEVSAIAVKDESGAEAEFSVSVATAVPLRASARRVVKSTKKSS